MTLKTKHSASNFKFMLHKTTYYIYIYRDSRLNRPESVSLASLARQLILSANIIFTIPTNSLLIIRPCYSVLTVLLKSRRQAIVVAYNGDTASSIDLEHGNRRLIQSLLLGQGWLIFQFVLDFRPCTAVSIWLSKFDVTVYSMMKKLLHN